MAASAGVVAARGAPTGPRRRGDFNGYGHGSHGRPVVPLAHSSCSPRYSCRVLPRAFRLRINRIQHH
ncbi:hypothetical protein N7504_006722 [Penicillium tannophilum]|nr:hypothetical protein N7504_006722 [Penicillium tannophilum]